MSTLTATHIEPVAGDGTAGQTTAWGHQHTYSLRDAPYHNISGPARASSLFRAASEGLQLGCLDSLLLKPDSALGHCSAAPGATPNAGPTYPNNDSAMQCGMGSDMTAAALLDILDCWQGNSTHLAAEGAAQQHERHAPASPQLQARTPAIRGASASHHLPTTPPLKTNHPQHHHHHHNHHQASGSKGCLIQSSSQVDLENGTAAQTYHTDGKSLL